MTSEPRRRSTAIVLSVATLLGCTTTFAVTQDPAAPPFPATVYEARSDARAESAATTTLAEALPGVEWSPCLALAAEKVLTESIDAPDPRPRDGRLHAITRAAGCPMMRKPDISLAKKELNWEPKVKLDEGLDKTISFFKDLIK